MQFLNRVAVKLCLLFFVKVTCGFGKSKNYALNSIQNSGGLGGVYAFYTCYKVYYYSFKYNN